MHTARTLAALVLVTFVVPASATAAPAPDPRAVQAVSAGRAAFDRGDYAGAIVQFEAARALRPAPKLHYNLGVCHMRLFRGAEARGDAPTASTHAAAAIEAFNLYLRDRPQAEDRPEVEAMVRALGGSPSTQARLRDTMAPAEPPSLKPTDEPTPTEPTPTAPVAAPTSTDGPAPTVVPTPTAAPAPTTAPAPTAAPALTPPPPALSLPRAYLGLRIGLAVQPQLTARADLRGGVQGLLVLHGGARMGLRRRVELGGQLMVAIPDQTGAAPVALSTAALLLDAGYALPLGRSRRFELPVAGFVGVAREALRVTGGRPAPACAIEGGGALVGARAGGVAGGRLGFAVLVGARRHHELGMHLTLAFHGFGPGPSGSSASACPAPARVLQDVPRARLVTTAALGYAFRF